MDQYTLCRDCCNTNNNISYNIKIDPDRAIICILLFSRQTHCPLGQRIVIQLQTIEMVATQIVTCSDKQTWKMSCHMWNCMRTRWNCVTVARIVWGLGEI